MMRLSASIVTQDILSLRTGGKIGKTQSFVINPNNLKIEGWRITNLYEKGDFILLSDAVREIISKGIIVDDHESLTAPEDLVRLKTVLDTEFELLGKKVITESKKNLGKVADFAINDNFMVQKLYVNQPILRGFNQEQLLIDRTNIIEITDTKIIINDPVVKSDATSPVTASA